MNRMVILDRDGVINQDSDRYIRSIDDWLPIPGSLEAVARLSRAEYRVVVITNQSGLARGYFDMETLTAIHEKMLRLLNDKGGKIEAIFFCPHGPDDNCECRKPKPGMFAELAARSGQSLRGIPAVGDSLRDLKAAASVGALPVLVKTGKGRDTMKELAKDTAFSGSVHVPVYKDLGAFVDEFLEGGLEHEIQALGGDLVSAASDDSAVKEVPPK
ncbi:MAG: D,D-heptose 1,7-bisphosphate phosphatase [marine bacterium B5-7]|nr:MAG: D,D-heptose 1,7-bisphosphate phosphatase [marine bacterium B5-7]